MGLSISSAHVGHYDLATFDPTSELMMYGTADADATDYFVRDVRRCILFSQIPVSLTKQTGEADFGGEVTFVVNRGGDYMTYTWLRLKVPEIKINATRNEYGDKGTIRWTRNLLHNIVAECNLLFSESRGARFDSFFLDFWAAFTVPSSKKTAYNVMIGNVDSLICPSKTSLPSMHLNLPLPLFYSRDTGVSLPVSSIAYNEIKLVFRFRRWQELIILDNTALGLTSATAGYQIQEKDLMAVPKLEDVGVFANYILLNSQDRNRVGCEPRVMLIEQVQTAPIIPFVPTEGATITTNVRFSFGVKCLMFGVRNRTRTAEWSNYSTHTPTVDTVNGKTFVNYAPEGSGDPVGHVSLTYDNSTRLQEVGADYFSLVNPYYHSPSIIEQSGYHLYSFALDFYNSDPTGSTNFSRIPSVDVTIKPSTVAVEQATAAKFQKYELILMAIVQNIMRIDGGVVGFPIH